jgi:hypothetical protein
MYLNDQNSEASRLLVRQKRAVTASYWDANQILGQKKQHRAAPNRRLQSCHSYCGSVNQQVPWQSNHVFVCVAASTTFLNVR